MKARENTKTEIIWKKIAVFVLLLLLVGSFTKVQQVRAAEPPVKITSYGTENTSDAIIRTAIEKLDREVYDYLELYRADSKNGTFTLIDEFPLTGIHGWGMNGVWSFKGEKGKVWCYTDSDRMYVGCNAAFKDETVKPGKTYYYKIVVKKWDNSFSCTLNTVSIPVELQTPTIRQSSSANGKTVKLAWYHSQKAKGYQVYRCDTKQKKWKLYKTLKRSKSTFTDKKVKAGKTYKYKVRAYAIVDGKTVYSKFSSVHTISLKKPTVKGNYKTGSVYGPALNNKELLQVRRVVQSFKTNHIRKGMSDYQKVWAAFSYLRNNCEYAVSGWQYNNANTAWGALVYGQAQCSGYARAMKALCDAAGIKCYYVHANAKADNPSHQWNEVKVDGKWYIVDAQSGYFLVGSKTWKNEAGMRWNTKGLPKCSASDHKKSGFYGNFF